MPISRGANAVQTAVVAHVLFWVCRDGRPSRAGGLEARADRPRSRTGARSAGWAGAARGGGPQPGAPAAARRFGPAWGWRRGSLGSPCARSRGAARGLRPRSPSSISASRPAGRGRPAWSWACGSVPPRRVGCQGGPRPGAPLPAQSWLLPASRDAPGLRGPPRSRSRTERPAGRADSEGTPGGGGRADGRPDALPAPARTARGASSPRPAQGEDRRAGSSRLRSAPVRHGFARGRRAAPAGPRVLPTGPLDLCV